MEKPELMKQIEEKKNEGWETVHISSGPVITHNRIQDAVRMLAAYEDTGLTPEEIAEGFNVSTTEKHRRNENV